MNITDKPLGYAWVEKYIGTESLIQASNYQKRHYLAETRRTKEILSGREDILPIWSQNLIDDYDKMGLVEHLCYAVKNEGIDLSLLSVVLPLFGDIERQKVAAIISEAPKSRDSSARKLGYMYEMLTQQEIPLDAGTLTKTGYDLLFSPDMYYTMLTSGKISAKYKITDNAIGDISTLCPVIRRTDELENHCAANYCGQLTGLISRFDEDVVKKACNIAAKDETQHSFIYEKDVKDAASRIEKFQKAMIDMDLTCDYLTENNLVQLQNTITSKYKQDTSFRNYQNFVGGFFGNRPIVSYLPLRSGLLRGYLSEVGKIYRTLSDPNCGLDPILSGSIVSCYFVLAHPFQDGNGRISRFLAQNVWMRRGYNKSNLIIPISEALSCSGKNKDNYIRSLQNITKPMMSRIEYRIAHRVSDEDEYYEPEIIKSDIRTYAYPDLTEFCETMYNLVKEASEQYLPQTIVKTQITETVKEKLKDGVGEKRLSKIVDICLANEGVLSKNKRRLFRDIPAETIDTIEKIVCDEYNSNRDIFQPEEDIFSEPCGGMEL